MTRPDPASVDLLSEYRRLAALFKVEVTSFERKQYTNLSHEPNKAMNLNSYLGLMGKSFHEAGSPDGRVLNQTTGDSYTTVTPRAASARRSSVGLNTQSLVNQAPRGLQPPSQPEPGAKAPGGDCTNVMHFDLVFHRTEAEGRHSEYPIALCAI